MKKLFANIFYAVLLALPFEASAQDWSLSINAADLANLATMNVDVGIAVDRHWTLNGGVKYNPWTFKRNENTRQITGQYQNRKLSVSAGARWWPWNVYSGWWTGSRIQYQAYNRGGLRKKSTEEGDAFGLAFSGGYSMMLNKHINLDLGFGIWGGYTLYTRYSCPKCGEILDKGGKWFVLPNEVIVSLSFIF